jgi:putative lipoic acid-binding regulatory protein
MTSTQPPRALLDFPCHFEFKAFGPQDDSGHFFGQVRSAVSQVVQVSCQSMRTRSSSAGKYQCVSVLVTLQNRTQLEAVYASLRKIADLKYLL